MRAIMVGLAVLAAAVVSDMRTGHAQYWQGRGPWCIQPSGLGSMWSCSYYSFEQCQMSLTGFGSCVRNPSEYWAKKGYGPKKGKKGKGQPSQQWW